MTGHERIRKRERAGLPMDSVHIFTREALWSACSLLPLLLSQLAGVKGRYSQSSPTPWHGNAHGSKLHALPSASRAQTSSQYSKAYP